MPAPTALRRAPEQLADEQSNDQHMDVQLIDASLPESHIDEEHDNILASSNDDSTLLDASALPNTLAPLSSLSDDTSMAIDVDSRPQFAPLTASPTAFKRQQRKVLVPPHRWTPLKSHWMKIATPLVENLKLQVRSDTKRRTVELRTSTHTTDEGALQKGEDFVKAFTLGFDVDDAVALLRLDDLYIQSFDVTDVKQVLHGDSLSRAIGRIAGKDGKTKFAIENASRTRIVLADQKVHLLGGFKNIGIAREAVVSLILGAPPGKVYNNLRTVSSRMKERF